MTPITTHDEAEASTLTSHAKVVLNAPSSSSSPLSPDETLPLGSLGHGTGLDGVSEDEEMEFAEPTLTLDDLPLAPIHSEHPNGQVSAASRASAEGDVEPFEEDVTEWHPLDHTRPDSKDMSQIQDTTFVEDSVAPGSDEKHLFVAAPRTHTSNPSLRINPKPPSPQPWDIVDPSNHGEGTDFYSTLGTKNFGTLQKKRYVPLRLFTPVPFISYYPPIAVHDVPFLTLPITLDLLR